MPRKLICCCLILFLFFGCQNQSVVTPKPRAYPRVDYPAKAYQRFAADYCNFTFSYPSYSNIEKDQDWLEGTVEGDCWFDVTFPSFNGRLHCTYDQIGVRKSFEELKQDAFELADYHNKRANYIDELRVNRPEEKVEGFVFAIEGPAATPLQFYLTDRENHFFRGSLYFNTQVRPDSIAPVYAFVRQDVMKLIETFSWTGE
jgi:gliding motility-associated lipoprotein GldD